MQGTRIDNNVYKAGLLRAAASSWAVMKGHAVDQIKKHANWLNNSSTFERYYYKPFNNFRDSQVINSTIFSATKNLVTSSEPRTETTMIGTSMPSKHTVAGVEGKDETITRTTVLNWLKALVFLAQKQA
ncbi:hypothetical protein RMATCC62417_14227 [Rhizopus microsporus]|nr:hypothetical protein RMATCC62417_14227 [Rhizopus microsporus]